MKFQTFRFSITEDVNLIGVNSLQSACVTLFANFYEGIAMFLELTLFSLNFFLFFFFAKRLSLFFFFTRIQIHRCWEETFNYGIKNYPQF